MKSEHNRLAVDVIGGAPEHWNAYLEQVCSVDITPFFFMDATARTGP